MVFFRSRYVPLSTALRLSATTCLSLAISPTAIAQNTSTYQCTPTEKITVTVVKSDSPQVLQVTLPDGRNVSMNQAESASGAKYTSGQVSFWSKGNTAFVQEGEKLVWRDCVKL